MSGRISLSRGLVFAALLIIFGRTGDRIGRRKVFMGGAIVFGLASVIAATTDSGTALIAAQDGAGRALAEVLSFRRGLRGIRLSHGSLPHAIGR